MALGAAKLTDTTGSIAFRGSTARMCGSLRGDSVRFADAADIKAVMRRLHRLKRDLGGQADVTVAPHIAARFVEAVAGPYAIDS